MEWMYVLIIVYVLIKSGKYKTEPNLNIFSKIKFKYVFLIVIVNVFFSYGMLYLANTLNLGNLLAFNLIPNLKDIAFVGGLIGTVLISPISEELIFRGIILNRLKLVVPVDMAILVSSLCFGVLHSYGSMISAFVFGLCMCVLYVKTDNILVPISAHIMNNFFAEVLFYLDHDAILFSNGIVMTVITILAIISLYLILNSLKMELNYLNKK
nr:CPBP family intramembrane glutamic endopeptidase [uncultured Methanobrevibacter sp.]